MLKGAPCEYMGFEHLEEFVDVRLQHLAVFVGQGGPRKAHSFELPGFEKLNAVSQHFERFGLVEKWEVNSDRPDLSGIRSIDSVRAGTHRYPISGGTHLAAGESIDRFLFRGIQHGIPQLWNPRKSSSR